MPVPPVPVAVNTTVWPSSTIAGLGLIDTQMVPWEPDIGVQPAPGGGGGEAPEEAAAGAPTPGLADTLTEDDDGEAAAADGPEPGLVETAPPGETVIVIGEEVTPVVAAALFELEAAAEDDEDEDELELGRTTTPVTTVMSGLVSPLEPAAPKVATGTVATWTWATYPPVPPFDGRAASTAGATAKPTSAISPTTSVHHVFECLALMSYIGADAPA